MSLKPPPGIRVPDNKELIDKTVGYILKNGETFAARLRDKERDKFPFMFNDDPDYEYYRWKMGLLEKDEQVDNDIEEEVEELKFLIEWPEVSGFDVQVIKLTALVTAENGIEYCNQLHNHEKSKGNKSQFQFLNEGHSLHALFLQFVEQYKQTLEILNQTHPPKFPDLLEDAYKRARSNKSHKVKQENEQKKIKDAQLRYASIDWQDFALVELVEFDAIDEVSELAVPLKREDLVYRSLESKAQDKQEERKDKEEKHKDNANEKPTSVNPHESNGLDQKHSTTKEPSPTGPVPKGIKIKAAGQTRLNKKSKERTIQCPLTNKAIPELQFDNHLRILLRDPSYKQQQDNYVKKNFKFQSNLTNEEVYENIKRLSRKRAGEQEDTQHKPKKPIGPQ